MRMRRHDMIVKPGSCTSACSVTRAQTPRRQHRTDSDDGREKQLARNVFLPEPLSLRKKFTCILVFYAHSTRAVPGMARTGHERSSLASQPALAHPPCSTGLGVSLPASRWLHGHWRRLRQSRHAAYPRRCATCAFIAEHGPDTGALCGF